MTQPKLILTEDGSHTLLNPTLNELYHSKHGAIQESQHVFIKMGFSNMEPKRHSLSILEIGFGTGLNAYLTLLENQQKNVQINYTAVESFPVLTEQALQLNYPTMLANKGSEKLFQKMHACDWEVETEIDKNFYLTKRNDFVQNMNDLTPCDLIYFDAFSPAVQPELWTENIFLKLYGALTSGGRLLTYCAKGEVKRTLKKVGFVVEGKPGPPGKREMTLAIKN